MPTQCNTKPLEFEPHLSRHVVADFDGGPITSDAGLLLLPRVDRHLSVSDQVADCFTDHRDPKRIRYSLRTLIAQRILGIAQGYEDLIDHGQLRHDPLMALVSGGRC
ncbi:MAG: transposase [Acidobacteriota bacterium]|nr:transposase [Acidobacteriota bacterium]MDE2965801.1 transposase [Acidobacteriota bacterium]